MQTDEDGTAMADADAAGPGRASELRSVGQRGLPLWPWGLVGLVTVPLAIAAIVVWHSSHFSPLFGDTPWYAAALPGLLGDGPLYDPAKLQPHRVTPPPFFDQAPSTALLTLPLALPAPYGVLVWGALMWCSVFGALGLLWPRVGPGGTVLLVPVLLAWPPIISLLVWTNLNALVLLLLAVALRFPRAAGMAIGLAAAAKVLPILAVAWLLGKRDWRGAVIAVAIPLALTGLVVAFKGPQTLTDFIVLRLNETITPWPERWGLVDAGLPEWVAYGLGLLLAGAAWRWASFSLAVIAMLVASPGLHLHYWTWLLVPLLGIWLPAMTGRAVPAVHATAGRARAC